MRVISDAGPRRPCAAVEPVAATPRDRPDQRRHERREPIVVHVRMPLRPSSAVSAVEEAYALAGERRAVDLYL